MRLSIQAVFGDGFYQDSQIIRVQKTSLNIEAVNNNSGTRILAGILLKALSNYQGSVTANGQEVTANGFIVTYQSGAEFDRFNMFLWQREFLKVAGIPKDRIKLVVEFFYLVEKIGAMQANWMD